MRLIRAYFLLMKPGIIFGNAITAAAGFLLASGNLDYGRFIASLIGLSLIVGAGCVLNNYFDRLSDQKMHRTKSRALARGLISEKNAIIFGVALLISGVFVLSVFTNPLATLIAVFGFIVYVAFYTVLKHKTVYGTEIGSIAGAVPPVVGYCAASGRFDLAASTLFAIVALWQMPHFFAIAMYRAKEYASASIPVLPLEKGPYVTKVRMLIYLVCFIGAASMLTVFGYVGYRYLAVTLLLASSWLWAAIQGFKSTNDPVWARKMFLISLVVIVGLCTMIAVDRL